MSVFDDQFENVPVTANYLRDIINRRKSFADTPDEEIYNRILMKIAEKVKYSVEEDVWEHATTLAALNITGNPFTSEYADQINDLIHKNKSKSEIVDWVNDHPIEPCDKLKKFVNFMRNRGFTVRFRTGEYLESGDRLHARVVIISWKEDNN